jgi:putative membrane protein insertion efficiency factor
MSRGTRPTWVTGTTPDAEVYRQVRAFARRREHPALELQAGLTAPQRWLVTMLRFYQRHLSSRVGRKCIFQPSCSSYAILAVATNGITMGGREAFGRWRRCRPFSSGGIDYPRGFDVPR